MIDSAPGQEVLCMLHSLHLHREALLFSKVWRALCFVVCIPLSVITSIADPGRIGFSVKAHTVNACMRLACLCQSLWSLSDCGFADMSDVAIKIFAFECCFMSHMCMSEVHLHPRTHAVLFMLAGHILKFLNNAVQE